MAVIGAPKQPLAVGVIVNVTNTGAFVVFTNVPVMSPVPLAPIPVTLATLSLVHTRLAPATELDNTTGIVDMPEQTVCDAGTAWATGIGLTRTVDVIAGPWQPLAVGVIVKVTTIGVLVIWFSEPIMSPLPKSGIPLTPTVENPLLVQLKVVPETPLNKNIDAIGSKEHMS